MVNSYIEMIRFENEMPLDNLIALGTRDWLFKEKAYKFFDEYEGYRGQVGEKKAAIWLSGMVKEHGFGVALTLPISRFHINGELMRQLLSGNPKTTAYCKHIYGEPPDFDEIQEQRGLNVH